MIKAVVTDIEGTTSSISFVKDVLFPYARSQMAGFVKANADKPEIRAQLEEVCQIIEQPFDLNGIIHSLEQWIDEDQKITPLKTLQGYIWAAGYQVGDFTGHVYPDAFEVLQAWKEAGVDLYVFSSGSVKAQKLIFGHSDFGDMTPLFKGYFDTTIGNKRQPAAYQTIVDSVSLPSSEILFLSDIVEELAAAAKVGMQTFQLVRESDGTVAAEGYRHAADFYAIDLSLM